jgi:exodeoxyribonuclease X
LLIRPDAFVAHHAEFDKQFFDGDGMPWICTRKVAMRLWPTAPNFKNQTLRYVLGLDEDPGFDSFEAMPPHRAGPDSYVTAHLLARALKAASVAQLIEWSNQPALLPGAIAFGKHRGTPWEKVEPSYLEWIVHGAKEMDADVKFTARHWLERRLADAR